MIRYASIATQYLKLAPGASRLHLTGRLFQTSNARPYPENDLTEWDSKDNLQVLIIKYGTTDTVAVHTVKAANAFGSNFNVELPITGFAGDTVKVKLAWRVHSMGVSNSLHITNYIIEEIPGHEAPVDLTVDAASNVGGRPKSSGKNISRERNRLGKSAIVSSIPKREARRPQQTNPTTCLRICLPIQL